MSAMRAKLKLHHITPYKDTGGNTTGELLRFHAVAAGAYGPEGNDENNTFAKFSPSASLEIHVANPVLIGKFEIGTEYYVDFTPAS